MRVYSAGPFGGKMVFGYVEIKQTAGSIRTTRRLASLAIIVLGIIVYLSMHLYNG